MLKKKISLSYEKLGVYSGEAMRTIALCCISVSTGLCLGSFINLETRMIIPFLILIFTLKASQDYLKNMPLFRTKFNLRDPTENKIVIVEEKSMFFSETSSNLSLKKGDNRVVILSLGNKEGVPDSRFYIKTIFDRNSSTDSDTSRSIIAKKEAVRLCADFQYQHILRALAGEKVFEDILEGKTSPSSLSSQSGRIEYIVRQYTHAVKKLNTVGVYPTNPEEFFISNTLKQLGEPFISDIRNN